MANTAAILEPICFNRFAFTYYALKFAVPPSKRINLRDYSEMAAVQGAHVIGANKATPSAEYQGFYGARTQGVNPQAMLPVFLRNPRQGDQLPTFVHLRPTVGAAAIDARMNVSVEFQFRSKKQRLMPIAISVINISFPKITKYKNTDSSRRVLQLSVDNFPFPAKSV